MIKIIWRKSTQFIPTLHGIAKFLNLKVANSKNRTENIKGAIINKRNSHQHLKAAVAVTSNSSHLSSQSRMWAVDRPAESLPFQGKSTGAMAGQLHNPRLSAEMGGRSPEGMLLKFNHFTSSLENWFSCYHYIRLINSVTLTNDVSFPN